MNEESKAKAVAYIPFSLLSIGDCFWSIDAQGKADILAMKMGNTISSVQPSIMNLGNPFDGKVVNAVALSGGKFIDGREIKVGQVLILRHDEAVIQTRIDFFTPGAANA